MGQRPLHLELETQNTEVRIGLMGKVVPEWACGTRWEGKLRASDGRVRHTVERKYEPKRRERHREKQFESD
jgi:hypothetical protein